MCVTVGFCVVAIYTPPPPSPFEREPSERAYTSTTHFLRENHLLMCWDQDIPIQPLESWSLAFPKLLSTQIIFPPYPNPPFVDRGIRTCQHFQHLFSEREPRTHVLRPRYSNPITRILIYSLPQVAFYSNHLFTKSKSVRESWVLGRLSFEAQEQGVHHQHTIYYLLESGVS